MGSVPIFYSLGLTSIYQYLEQRFGRITRLFITGSFDKPKHFTNVSIKVVFLIQSCLYNGLVVYAPALAMERVAGLDINVGIVVVGCVGILYTTLGGMKAVVWTDVFQTVWMVSGFLVIVSVAAVDFGGFDLVLEVARRGGRTNGWEFDIDPR